MTSSETTRYNQAAGATWAALQRRLPGSLPPPSRVHPAEHDDAPRRDDGLAATRQRSKRSVLCVPLSLERATIGSLSVRYPTRDHAQRQVAQRMLAGRASRPQRGEFFRLDRVHGSRHMSELAERPRPHSLRRRLAACHGAVRSRGGWLRPIRRASVAAPPARSQSSATGLWSSPRGSADSSQVPRNGRACRPASSARDRRRRRRRAPGWTSMAR